MDSLPEDCLTGVLSNLDAENVARSLLVCKAFYTAGTTSSVWRQLCIDRWLFCNASALPKAAEASETSRWYRYYSLRRNQDAHIERGRPRVDYTAKTLRAHRGLLTGAAYLTSLDAAGPVIASSSRDGAVKASDVINGTVLWEGDTNGNPVCCLTLDKQSDHLLTGDREGLVSIWDPAESPKAIAELQGSQFPISAIVKRDDSHLALVCSTEGMLRFWDLRSCELVHALPIASANCHRLSYAPKNDNVVSLCSMQGSSEILLYDIRSVGSESPSVFAQLYAPAAISCYSWIPGKSDNLIAGCTSGTLCTFKTNEDQRSDHAAMAYQNPTHSIMGHHGGISCMGLSGHRLVTGGNDGAVKLWHVEKPDSPPEATATYRDHKGAVTDVSVDTFRVLSCSADYSIRVYRWERPRRSQDWTLESRYTLLGGSLRGKSGGFSKVLCDNASIVGLADENIKAYNFKH